MGRRAVPAKTSSFGWTLRALGIVITLGTLYVSEPARAMLLYDNGSADATCCTTVSDFDLPLQIADGFLLNIGSDVVVTEIAWSGSFGNPTEVPPSDNFTIRFFYDEGGLPGLTPFAVFAVGNAVSRTPVDPGVRPLFYRYSATLSVPLALDNDTQYFLSIVANTVGYDANWSWTAADFPEGAQRIERTADNTAWSGNGLRNYNFRLFGGRAPVPEPATLSLLGLGLAGLGLSRRRQS